MVRRAGFPRDVALLTFVVGAILSMTVADGRVRAEPTESRVGELRVLTWNIQYGMPIDGEHADLERVAAVIRAEAPDVVALTELHDDDDLPGGHGDQPAELAALLAGDGYRYTYYDATEVIPWRPDDGAGLGCGVHAPAASDATDNGADDAVGGADRAGTYSCGNMVLSRHPLYTDPDDPRGPKRVVLPTEHVDPDGRERRALLELTARVPGIGDVGVFITHLSQSGSDLHVADQKTQVRTLVAHLESVGEPMVLAGDLNIRPSDAPTGPTANNLLRSWIADTGLVDTWTRVQDSSDGVTVTRSHDRPDGEHPDRRIDYVYASPAFTVRDAHMSLIDPSAADHLPVVTDLRLRRPPMWSHATTLAGEDGLSGWGQVAVDRGNRVSLTACKNVGTTTDDGTVVRASLHEPSSAEPVRVVDDGGTSRDRCTTHEWRRDRLAPDATLRACVVRGDEVFGCRDEPIHATHEARHQPND